MLSFLICVSPSFLKMLILIWESHEAYPMYEKDLLPHANAHMCAGAHHVEKVQMDLLGRHYAGCDSFFGVNATKDISVVR